MLLIIWSVNNHQIVTGIIVVNIVKHNINKYINVNADNFIFVLSDIKFYFYIISV